MTEISHLFGKFWTNCSRRAVTKRYGQIAPPPFDPARAPQHRLDIRKYYNESVIGLQRQHPKHHLRSFDTSIYSPVFSLVRKVVSPSIELFLSSFPSLGMHTGLDHFHIPHLTKACEIWYFRLLYGIFVRVQMCSTKLCHLLGCFGTKFLLHRHIVIEYGWPYLSAISTAFRR